MKRALLLLLFITVTVAAISQDKYPARCRTTARLNVRISPSKNATKLGLFQQGQQITVEYTTGSGNDPWGAVSYGSRRGYVSMKYVSYIEPVNNTKVSSGRNKNILQLVNLEKYKDSVFKFLIELWGLLKWLLIIFVILLIIGLWDYIVQFIFYVGFFAVAGAVLFAIFGGSGSTGAIVGLIVAALMGARLIASQLESTIGSIDFGGIFRFFFLIGYYIISTPTYWLNRLEHFLIEPWRYLFRSDWVYDGAKPVLRIVLEVLSVLLYILTTPLRLLNAVVYNMLIHCITSLYDLFFEVLLPCDGGEGAGSIGRWILMFPWRFVKYPIWHGMLTIIESVVWTVVDVIIPARTLYHGTNLAACQAITVDPDRNGYLRHISDWTTGTFMASARPGNSWGGRGVYFAIDRQLALSYSWRAAGYGDDPVMIACRVSMGRVVNYTLAPSHVYNQTGALGNHDELNRFGDRHGYTTGEWYNPRGVWEYCLFDWQDRYNHPWRIRPIYILNVRTFVAQHVRGGVQHWLFDRAVINDILSCFENLLVSFTF